MAIIISQFCAAQADGHGSQFFAGLEGIQKTTETDPRRRDCRAHRARSNVCPNLPRAIIDACSYSTMTTTS